MSGSEVERIERAALKIGETVYDLPRPARHSDVYRSVRFLGADVVYGDGSFEGFVTSAGRFVERVEATMIARAAGQARLAPGQLLQTVDLW